MTVEFLLFWLVLVGGAAGIGLVVVLVILVSGVRKLKREVRAVKASVERAAARGETGVEAVADRDGVQGVFDQSIWPQVEALAALYRMVDGKTPLPFMRQLAVSPDLMRLIFGHILARRPKYIVECGAGSSTIVMAHALQRIGEGRIISLENHFGFKKKIDEELKLRGLDGFARVYHAPLVEKRYPGVDRVFQWYDLSDVPLEPGIDLLLVDGPLGILNKNARFPAGPELLGRMARSGHIFLDDANRPEEKRLGSLWRNIEPELGVRSINTEKGTLQMFFLDHAMDVVKAEVASSSNP